MGRCDIGTVVTLPLIMERAKSIMEFYNKKWKKKRKIWKEVDQFERKNLISMKKMLKFLTSEKDPFNS